MAYRVEKETGDIVVDGFEDGIYPSPHRGLANIQNANIATETGEVVNSFARIQQSMTETATTGSLTYLSTDHVNLSITGSNNLFKGNWITVTNSSNTGQLPNGTYYVPLTTGAGFELANYYNVLTYTLPATATYLIVGGGAGGGDGVATSDAGGGAGGGQVKPGTVSLSAGSYPITVAASVAAKTNGNSSTAFGITSAGGIKGVDAPGGGLAGGAGGASGSGNAGGTSTGLAGAGGGGDSAVGQTIGGTTGGNGGAGTSSSITGSAIGYGGGAGGGTANVAGGTATDGGGAGATSTVNAVAGTTNRGGGGGGGGFVTGHSAGAGGGSGVVIISYVIGSIIGATGGSISYYSSGGISYTVHTFNSNGTFVVPTPPATILTGFTAGLTATIQLAAVMGKPLASAIETYYRSGTVYNRYYILDNQNLVWVYDTYNETLFSSSDNVAWFLPDFHTDWCTGATGIGVISGFLVAATQTGLYGKPVALLGNTNSTSTTWTQFHDFSIWQGGATNSTHFCYVGHQGVMYVTDGNYITSIFPDSTLADTASTSDNVQSFDSWTVSANNYPFVGIPTVISGSSITTSDGKRLPAVFFTTNGGALPTALTAGTVYYISGNSASFSVYSASTGGSALDLASGAVGTQYFNVFYPIATDPAYDGSTPTFVLTPQRLTLPNFEVAQCMAEVGNLVIVGCISNILYPWDQVQNLPGDIIPLAESNTKSILTVNKMGYVFTGNKGNIYITDGSVASAVTTVPDYCAGVPGIPSSYIEPYFDWGGTMYLRGRVYFSIIDQTSTKAGNCGGVWSFVPTQNLYIGQDVGIGLRLENQNSYGTYNGGALVLIPRQTQNFIAPQYWSAWESSITSPIYGIDTTGTGTASTSVTIVETDAIPTGTMLEKMTFQQIEFKLATPLLTTDDVTVYFRKDITSAWTSLGPVSYEGNRLSGLCGNGFEKTQWLQLQIKLTSGMSSSFIRLSEIRLR